MGRASFLTLTAMMIVVSACDGNLKAISRRRPLTPANADVTISKAGIPLSATHYSNDSATNYLRCEKDRKQFYIEARRFVVGPDNEVDDRMITLFFPDPTKSARVNAEWTGGAVQLYGKLAPYRSLGGRLDGSCQANLKFDQRTQILKGSIACQNFQNTDAGGIGDFDFSIANLSCRVQ